MTATSIFETTRSLIPVPRRAARSPSVSHIAAQALGWFSIVLGALAVAAPKQLTRRLGLRGKEPVLRRYGGREIASGVAALAASSPRRCGRESSAIWASARR